MNLTDEQKAIIGATPDAGGTLLISAFAGTGKTFTLQQYAEERPVDKILYAAYNKTIQLEAERKMPANVSCRTTHSLAYHAFGAEYRDKGMLSGSLPLWRVVRLLETNFVIANFVVDILGVFLASADEDINNSHIPQHVRDFYSESDYIPPLTQMADLVWEDMKSMRPKSLPMTHDGYLKLYQLSGPKLNFNYILLDEAQDTTPCVWDIFKNQTCRKIVVGDPYQAIYGWRGAIDALDLVDDAIRLSLSQSFRFGPDVANLASTLLRRFKGEKLPLRGFEPLHTKVHISNCPDSIKHTTISRGNISIFRSVASECHHGNKTFGFVGGDHKNYRFQTILDAYYLFSDQKELAKDPLIKSFSDFLELREYGQKAKNAEIESACIIAEEYGGQIPEVMKIVRVRDVGARFSDLSYVTGHRSKGMEFPFVHLASDFTRLIDAHNEDPQEGILDDDEMNLLYVAITRATEGLYISPAIHDFIQTGSLYPVPEDRKEIN